VLYKQPAGGGKRPVTFRLPPEVGADTITVVGDFNGWSESATPLTRTDDGFSVTLSLEVGKAYRFRYLIDGVRWENDWAADDYRPNDFGGDDSVVDLTDAAAPSVDASEPPSTHG
jgi:1,4-alpha-glucan branching enzyme